MRTKSTTYQKYLQLSFSSASDKIFSLTSSSWSSLPHIWPLNSVGVLGVRGLLHEEKKSCFFVTINLELTLFTLGPTRTYLPWGEGGIWPCQKISCQVGLKHGRISKGGLNITFNPKKSHPRSSGCLRENLKMLRQTALRYDFARIL